MTDELFELFRVQFYVKYTVLLLRKDIWDSDKKKVSGTK